MQETEIILKNKRKNMCDNSMDRFENGTVKRYTCSEVKKEKRKEWIEKFRQENIVDIIEKRFGEDKRFMEFEQSLNKFILECKDTSYQELIESLPKNERIKFAKDARELGYSAWNEAPLTSK